MQRIRVVALAPQLAAAGLVLLLAACGGSSSSSAGAPSGDASALELTLVEAPAGALGLLDEGVVSWRANRSVRFSIELRGTDGSVLLESGDAQAGELIAATVHGAELDAQGASVVSLSATDDLGSQVSAQAPLELGPIEAFELGLGLHNDLAFDATRDELYVSNVQTGYVQLVDVDPLSPSYGQVVATLPPGPDAGPIEIDVTPDGLRGFELNRSTLLSFDLASLVFEDNQFLPGAFPPSSLAVAPDSSRLYIGYFHTLLFRAIAPSGPPAPIQSIGSSDGLIEGGDVEVSPDGTLVLYAWFGGPNRALWVVDGDPQSASFHEILAQQVFPEPPLPEVFGPDFPRVSVAPSSKAAYVGNLSGVFRIALDAPGFPVTHSRTDLAFTGLVAVEADGIEFVLLTGPFGTLTVLDAELETLGFVELDPILVDRSAVDRERGRLFLVSQQEASKGRLLVIPLD